MATMTSRERLVAAFEHRTPDRVPAYDLLRNDGAIAHYAGERVTPENWQTVVPRAVSRCLDLTRSLRGPRHPERVEHPDGSVEVHQRWTTWHPVKRIRSVDELLSNFRRVAEAPLPTAAQAREAAQQLLAQHLHWQALCEPCLLVWQIGGVGLMGAYGLAGLELFSYALADDPETVSAYLAAVAERHIQRVHAVAAAVTPELYQRLAPIAFVGDDVAHTQGPMFGQAVFERDFYPHLRRIVEAYHQHGIFVMFHSDGNLWPILDRLVDTGIDGLNPIEVNAGMDLARLKQQYGPRLTFCGGVDIHRLVRYGSLTEVIEGVRSAMREAGADGGYLCGSSTELDHELPAQNVVALLETIRQEGGYPGVLQEAH
ncbi:MAG: hypothetical protein IT204_12080 [Fimbriimonadaceae bacterium]|nr:hypothetical protein [Fimbriimonadaceae bacterium]